MYSAPPPFGELLTALILSTISGAISISRRIVNGQSSSILWIVSEFMTAILCGYLMFTAYPTLAPHIPDWITSTMAVAVAAHSGGRIFQEAEEYMVRLLTRLLQKT